MSREHPTIGIDLLRPRNGLFLHHFRSQLTPEQLIEARYGSTKVDLVKDGRAYKSVLRKTEEAVKENPQSVTLVSFPKKQ